MGFNLGSLLIGECFRYCPKSIWIKSWLLNFVLVSFTFPGAGLCCKEGLRFLSFLHLKILQIHFHKLEFVSKIGQLITLNPVNTQVEVSVH